MPAAVNYWSEGAEQPIDLDEVAYYAPTYWDNMKDTIETYGKLDGENAFIFAERDPIYYNWVTLIRKDWLDQVGLDVPTSNEELKTAMLTALPAAPTSLSPSMRSTARSIWMPVIRKSSMKRQA